MPPRTQLDHGVTQSPRQLMAQVKDAGGSKDTEEVLVISRCHTAHRGAFSIYYIYVKKGKWEKKSLLSAWALKRRRK